MRTRRGAPGAFAMTLLFVLAAFNARKAPADAGGRTAIAASELETHSIGSWGVDLADRDPSVKPGDDFFTSENGNWLARVELTPEAPFAAYWADLRRLSPRRLVALLEEAAADKNVSPESAEGKAGAFYRAFLDEKTIEARGVSPLSPELDEIRGAKTKAQLAAVMGSEAGPGSQPGYARIGFLPGDRAVFLLRIGQDQRDPSRYAVYVGQGGLGLPGPEYYADPRLKDVRAAYLAYATRLLTVIGWPEPETRAREIVDLETRIAAVSWSHEQMRDVVKTYNRMTIDELSALAPDFDWRAFLAGADLDRVRDVVVDAKSAFPRIARIYAESPIETLRARQAFLVADDAAPNLNASVVQANFEFRNRVFNSQSAAPRPRPIQASFLLEANVGELLGTLYVKRYFSPEARALAIEMSETMKRALDARLQRVGWMSPASRTAAREKLAKLIVNIGYPEKLQDYRGLRITDTDLYGNVRRSAAYAWHRQVERLDLPFDRREWTITPQQVTYNYNPTTNAVEIPAASLQPPFFDIKADLAVNYGAFGSVIGAMIVSAFDSRGQHYDADGRLHDWLTPEEIRKFESFRKAVADQYSAVEQLPGMHVKGDLVADEAMDDIGGIRIALDGYRLSLNGRPAPVLDGFTGDQRVFLGRAQMWRAKFDRAFVRTLLATGRNAHPSLRVNGPVRNLDDWYEAFHVGAEDKMYIPPERRVPIW